jgi:protein CpxP
MAHRTRLSSRTAAPISSVATAALIVAAMLLAPPTAARGETGSAKPLLYAQATPPQQSTATPKGAAAGATEATAETVEQRITSLRAALQITREQDAKWQAVAQAMRQNAAAMEKLTAEIGTRARTSLTAVDDLQLYQTFAQAHVDGLKNLIDDFKALYAAMPDAQKSIADQVFRAAGE